MLLSEGKVKEKGQEIYIIYTRQKLCTISKEKIVLGMSYILYTMHLPLCWTWGAYMGN